MIPNLGFVLYYDYRKHLQILTDEERGKLLMALMDYGENHSEQQLEGAALMAFSFITCQMDRDAEKYEKTVKKRREAGAKGGRPPKETEGETEPEKAKKEITCKVKSISIGCSAVSLKIVLRLKTLVFKIFCSIYIHTPKTLFIKVYSVEMCIMTKTEHNPCTIITLSFLP